MVIGVILVRVCEPVFQNLPHSYTWPLKKTDPFIYSIIQNVDLFIYCPLIFCIHCLLIVRQISVSSLNTKRTSSLEKSLSEPYYVHVPGCQKNGAFYIGIQKNRVIHLLFCWKKGAYHIPSKGLFGTHIRTMPYIGSYPFPPSPPPPPNTLTRANYPSWGLQTKMSEWGKCPFHSLCHVTVTANCIVQAEIKIHVYRAWCEMRLISLCSCAICSE